MERFFSQHSIKRYRKLLDISTDEPQRRAILKSLAAQAHTMRADLGSTLNVRTKKRGKKYIWELHRYGGFHPLKYSAPVYFSEEAARTSGNKARTAHLAHLARWRDSGEK
jgi:hypothetical protein